VYEAARDAVERGRKGEGATFIEAKTYRQVPHSSDDDDRRYRTREEVDGWLKKDPLLRFQEWLEKNDLLSKKALEEMQQRAATEVDEATEYAENAPKPTPESALERVFVE
jgi:2-oxoisovalerate dehydrogenase E1 component alpha subunit